MTYRVGKQARPPYTAERILRLHVAFAAYAFAATTEDRAAHFATVHPSESRCVSIRYNECDILNRERPYGLKSRAD